MVDALDQGSLFSDVSDLKWALACQSARQMRMHRVVRNDGNRFEAVCSWNTLKLDDDDDHSHGVGRDQCSFRCTATLSTSVASEDPEADTDSDVERPTDSPGPDEFKATGESDDVEAKEALQSVLSAVSKADRERLQFWEIRHVCARHSCSSAPPTKKGQKASPFDPSMFLSDCLDQVRLRIISFLRWICD
jgi:hypothetical protein